MSAAEVIATALLAEGAAPGSSLHSWRCEYPDRYGDCDCVQQTAEIVLAAIRAMTPPEQAEVFGGTCPDCAGNRSEGVAPNDTDRGTP